MRVLEPGHIYELQSLDGDELCLLTFTKRVGPSYPGNAGRPHPGTNCQEVLRALENRCRYLAGQYWCVETAMSKWLIRVIIWLFEFRAARIKRRWPPGLRSALRGTTCPKCGHVHGQVGADPSGEQVK